MTVRNNQETPDDPGECSPEPAVCNEVAGGVSGVVVQAGTINGGIHQHRSSDQVPVSRQSGRRALRILLPVVLAGGTIMVVALMPHRSSPTDQGRPAPSSSSSAPSAASSPEGPATRAPDPSPIGSEESQRGPEDSSTALPLPPENSQPITLSPGADAHLQNVATNQCVFDNSSGYAGFEICGASYAHVWTLRRSQGEAFQLVNSASGDCLYAPYGGDGAVGLGSCGGLGVPGHLHWRIGSSTAAGQTLENTEAGNCLAITTPRYGGGNQVMVGTCDSDSPEQLWKNSAKS